MLTLLAYKLGNDGTRNNVSQIDMEDSRIRSIPHLQGAILPAIWFSNLPFGQKADKC